MSHAFKFCVVAFSAMLGMGDRVLAQCFVCSDGNNNTAVGTSALYTGPSGANNTAAGANALYFDTTGNGNTATGYSALHNNATGSYNTSIGYVALADNTAGSYTTAVGAYSLAANTTGGYDTAFGAYSLSDNTTGTGNTAFGYAGLRSNTTGSNNIGFGYQSLYSNTAGSNNIAMGYQAAYYVLGGSNNIELGNMGAGADNNMIRIGAQGTQKETSIAGIYGTPVTGSAVYVTSSGQLGVLASSERYKTDISNMSETSAKLSRLRPVTFRYKKDPQGALQYGLIAEEVDNVYPELVIRDEAGKIQGVRYEELTPMLLNEVQQLKRQMAELQRANLSMRAAMAKLAAKDEHLAMR
jgi:hypothetical protein